MDLLERPLREEAVRVLRQALNKTASFERSLNASFMALMPVDQRIF